MRIHRIALCNVKGVTERTLEFPDTGVVVIEGPNEIGKSTFLEAFDRLLDPKAKASSKAASIVGLQPVGHDVGPFVEAEMTVGPHRLVFAKRWLRQPMTTLRVLSPVPEQLSGEAAQQRMDAIMDAAVDRPLLDALRFAQSGSSGPIQLGESAVLAAALDGAAGADLHSTGSGDLLEAVEAEYRRYYTASTGKPAGDFRAAIAAAHQRQDAVVEADRGVSEAAAILGKRDQAAAMHHVAKDAVPAMEQAWRVAQRAAERVSGLREQERQGAQRVASAGLTARAAEAAVRARQGLVDDAAERAAAAQFMTVQAAAATHREREVGAALAEVTDVLNGARDACLGAQDDADEAAVAVKHLQTRAEVASLQDRVEAAEEASVSLKLHRRALAEAVVTPAVWRELERRQQQLAIADAALEAGSTSVTLSALKEGQHVVHNGQAQALLPGEPGVQVSAAQESELIINGSVRVAITPHADVVARAAHRDHLLVQLRHALDEVKAADIDHAAALHDVHQRTRDNAAQSERDLAVALSGSTLSDLGELLAESRMALTHSTSGVSATSTSGGGHHAIGRVSRDEVDQAIHLAAALQAKLRLMRTSKDTAEDEVRRVRDLHAVSERASGVADSQHAAATAESKRAKERMDLTREASSDQALASAEAEAIAAEGVAAADHRQLQDALLAVDAAQADHQLTVASAGLHEAQAEQERLAHLLQNLNGQLEITAGEGRQEAYERAVQVFEEAKRALSSVDRRARAARQLHLTLQRHRERAHASYVAPYADEIERLGRSLYGDSFGIVISPNLVMTHRHLHGATVAFEHLSGGAREQLGIVARLAVAMLVESDQSVPVVIDDALGYTDPERLQLLGALLGGSDHRGQIILLTCTPERYRAIPGAATVRLSA